MGRKWTILVVFFSMLTLLTSIIGTSLILINENTQTDINGSSIIANKNIYKNSIVVYEQNNNLNIVNLLPGEQKNISFSISNLNSNQIRYKILWKNINTSWIETESYFIYTLSCTDGTKIENKIMPIKEEPIMNNLILNTNQSNSCTITISNQNWENIENTSNYFKGTVKVEIEE